METDYTKTAVDDLKDRVRAEGKNLGNNILKVDSLINHQLDPQLMAGIGAAFAERFADSGVNKVLTAEVSGIAPAVLTGLALNVPVVYARKHQPITMVEPIYREQSTSPTKKHKVELMVSHEFLNPGDQVLIVDDFLASGKTLHALARIVEMAGAELVGIACVIEKAFQGGRDYIAEHIGVQVESAVVIAEMTDTDIILAD